MNKILINTDKNGTKTYHCTDRCFKCGGTGIISYYIPINGGECFDCHGSGMTEWTEKEYTEEYAAKLEARRIKKAEKKLMEAKSHAEENNQKFFQEQEFTPEGKTFYILGKTFDIKDQLKSEGAKWDNYTSHWRMNHPYEGYGYLELSVDDIYDKDYSGTYHWNSWKRLEYNDSNNYYNWIREAEEKLNAKNSTSEYLGQEGERITLTVTYTHTSSFERELRFNKYDTVYIHSFRDENGNEIIWKTTNNIYNDKDTEMIITGTVKGYKEYKGIKQTILTRCKLEEVK